MNKLPKPMRSLWFWCCSSLLISAPLEAAEILQKSVQIAIHQNGSVKENVSLKIRLDDSGDLREWAFYPVYLNDHRNLNTFQAYVHSADGRRNKIGRKSQDRMESSAAGIAHDSSYYHVVEFPGLAVGAILEIAHEVEVAPYYPAGQLALLSDEPIQQLNVRVSGGGSSWRWRLDGPQTSLHVEESPGGVTVQGQNLEALEPGSLQAGGAGSVPILRYAWGADDSWQGVGRWFNHLLETLPRDHPSLKQLAADLTEEEQAPRQKLEEMLAYMRRKVRYVAVEMGIGGFRPSPPQEVLERRWGDCKDKALMLIDLLQEVGIEAHPALILSDSDSRIDPQFPSPAQFNHAIVAVPQNAVQVSPQDPVSDNFLFLDPTQEHGRAQWLHPGVQDQHALVVTPDGGVLARTPIRQEHESHFLAADLQVLEDGSATGRAGLLLQGGIASSFIYQIDGAAPERTGEDVLAIFKALLPGVQLSDVGWEKVEGAVPGVRMSAAVQITSLLEGTEPRRSFRIPSIEITPEPRKIDDEAQYPIVHPASMSRTLWRLTLPKGICPPKAVEKTVENPSGLFRQKTWMDENGNLNIERRTELRQRWFEPENQPHLKAIALAEHRASRRRIRLRCEEEAQQSGR